MLFTDFTFNLAETNRTREALGWEPLSAKLPLNPLLFVFTGKFANGLEFQVHTTRWAAGHTESFTARLVVNGARLALPVTLPDPEKPMKVTYHDSWFAQYPSRLAEIANISMREAEGFYQALTAATRELEATAWCEGKTSVLHG